MASYKQLLKRTMPAKDGKPPMLQYLLVDAPMPTPQADEVVIRVGGAPINPSDLGGMVMGSDRLGEAQSWSKDGAEGLNIPLPDHYLFDKEGDLGPFGNEGAGVVESAGKDATHLIGKTVFFQGGTYTQVTCRKMADVQVQPDGVSPKLAASSFVNPMTAMGMVEKMRREGHKALVHTAAASQLGQMLVRLCLEEKVQLVNIVRSPEQVKLLKDLGAKYVVDTSQLETLRTELVSALVWSGATMAFDALGGGKLGSFILECMEEAAWRRGDKGSYYGSSVWKQLYIYGRLDTSPGELALNFGGYRWNIGGYLVSDFLETTTEEWREEAKARIAKGLSSTFKTEYAQEISLKDLLNPDNLKLADAKGTKKKLLVVP